MKLTNKEVVEKLNGIGDIVNREEKYNIKYSFFLIKNRELLMNIYKPFELARDEIIKMYCEVLEDGSYEVLTGKETEFKKEMDALLSIENECEPHIISISDLPTEITAKDLYILNEFIKE